MVCIAEENAYVSSASFFVVARSSRLDSPNTLLFATYCRRYIRYIIENTMPSSKKKKNRGKEKKAKYARVVRFNVSLGTTLPPPKGIVDIIRRGVDFPIVQQMLRYGDKEEDADIIFRERLLDEGLVPALLEGLNKCNHETVLVKQNNIHYPDDKHAPASPGYCFCILSALMMVPGFSSKEEDAQRIRLEIARGIGPVVNCMCNDDVGEFFQSKKFWHVSIERFIELIRGLAQSREAIEILLQYDGLLELVIQCLFWRTHRKDIMQGFKEHKVTSINADIEERAKDILDAIVSDYDEGVEGTGIQYFGKRGRKILERIALAPIVSRRCDPNCGTQFIVALLDSIKANKSTRKSSGDSSEGSYYCADPNKGWYIYTLSAFVVAGCVDKQVISEIIGIGASASDDTVVALLKIIFDIVCPRTGEIILGVGHRAKEDDTRFAVAINHGLIEMCLKLLAQHCRKDGSNQLVNEINDIFDSMKNAALMKKSSQAIAVNHGKIAEKLRLVEPILAENNECHHALQMIEAILNTVPDKLKCVDRKESCSRCNKELEKGRIQRCGKCKKATYCSRQCQVDDWRNGDHKFYCKAFLAIEGGGGTKKDAKRTIAHIDSIEEVGQKAISEKFNHVLIHALFMEYDILDSVVVIDLHLSRNRMKLMLLDEFLGKFGERILGGADNTKELIENHKAKERLVCAFSTSDAVTISYVDKSLAPWGGSWPASQDVMKAKFDNYGALEVYRMHPLDPVIRNVPGPDNCFDRGMGSRLRMDVP